MKSFVLNCYNFYWQKILIFSKIVSCGKHAIMRDFENMPRSHKKHKTSMTRKSFAILFLGTTTAEQSYKSLH